MTEWARVKIFLNQAFPNILSCICTMLMEFINVAAAGRLNSTTKVAGLGIGNQIQNMLGIVICIGMNNALNTLSPLAAGTGDLKLGLTYLRRGQVVLTICFIPILGLMLCSESILIMIGQDPVVSRYAHEYNLAFLPAVYLFGIRDTTRRFLASVNQN
mgnify:CR=1 FL=1|jgi:multidrug resistance protein, MATE family